MDWRDRAACLDEDPELFFPIGNTGPALLQIEEAKQVCRRCDVREQCLAWAADAGVEDAYFHEELAEDYAALGRYDDARAQARRALELVSDEDDPARVARLRELSLTR